jgi:hypothetical protein
MSTNFAKQEKEIRPTRKWKKIRVTKHVRLIKTLHEKLKEVANIQKRTLSKVLEDICHFYFKNNK